MRKTALLMLSILTAMLLFGCGECKHEYSPATCTTAATCTKCGQAEGEALGHVWKDATCTDAAICERCSQTQGAPLGHEVKAATCEDPASCTRCGSIEAEALGHAWEEATCTAPKTCSVCAKTEGDALGHSIEEWRVTKDSTCSEEGIQEGVCSVCSETVEMPLDKAEHSPSDWQVTVAATKNSKGTRTITCKVCGEVLETEQFELTPEEIEKEYKKQCASIGYSELQRNPGENKGKYITVSGSVFQIISEAKSNLQYSLYFMRNGNNLYLLKIDNYGSGSRILKNDRIQIWGEVSDLFSYETVRGDENIVPTIIVEYYQ